MKAVVIIPARYASTRLPGKPLADICGKSMLERVWRIAMSAKSATDVYIATDDERVSNAARAFGAHVIITSAQCSSGTERLIEAAKKIEADIYINLQGDEPLLKPEAIDTLVALFANPDCQLASLYCPISEADSLLPQNVKVVLDHQENALYFSRAQIPYPRNKIIDQWWGHLGIYGYRRAALLAFADLPPSPLEKIEQLEQLRYLQAGYRIAMARVEPMGGGVDTPEDLERTRAQVREAMAAQARQKLGSIKMIVTDVDGVLTDGALYYGPEGEIIKKFDARDGAAIIELRKMGIPLAILSGRRSEALARRAEDLGIKYVIMGSDDKVADLDKLLGETGLTSEEIAYIGDDYPDLGPIQKAGVGITVAEAHEGVKAKADLTLDKNNGSIFAQIYEIIKGART